MATESLPTNCQEKLAASSNCIECGAGVDALVLLGDIAFCPVDAVCVHHGDCVREAAKCAGELAEGSALKSRLLKRMRLLDGGAHD
jgi:hypothetical protein